MHCLRGLFSLYLTTVVLFACREAPPEPPVPLSPEPAPTVFLTVQDAGVTEAWLKLSIPDTVLERTFALVRDSQVVFDLSLTAGDTTLIDEGLLPNHLYTYRAYRMNDSTVVDSTDPLSLTTLDTTSHNFFFDIDTLGDGSSSLLNDVAIVSEDNIWAVGEVYLKDSTGQYEPTYNVARWDGSQWTLSRAQFPTCDPNGNEQGTNSYPATSIFAFSPSDIWITCRVSLVHWNGLQFQRICMPLGYGERDLTKLWGYEGKVYLAGTNGFLAFFDGTTWQRIESGTTLDIYDIFGAMNPTTNELEVYAVAAEQFVSFDKRILRIAGNIVTAVSDSSIPYSIHGIWFKSGRRYYVVGSGMYDKRDINSNGAWRWLHPAVTEYYTYATRGNDLNDVVACGAFGELLHFNGSIWVSYRSTTVIANGAFYGVAVSGDVMVAVGYESPRAVVVIGRR